MKEENRKEILTREIIKKELKEIYKHNIAVHIELPLVLMLWPLLILMLVYSSESDVNRAMEYAFMVFSYILIALLLGYAVFSAVFFLRLLLKVNKNQFDIVTEKLANTEKSRFYKYRDRCGDDQSQDQPNWRKPLVYMFPFLADKSYKLIFLGYKKFYIPEGKLYRWSKKYRMEDWAVYRWAETGDDFYLIIIDKKIRYVYNAKHFELQE